MFTRAINLEAGFAQAVDQVLDELGLVPFPEELARDLREIGFERQQLSYRRRGCLAIAELPVKRREQPLREVLPRHAGLGHQGARGLVVSPAIGIKERERPVPRWVIRIEPPRRFPEMAPALPVS